MGKPEVESAQIIWEGEIRAIKLRILQVAEDDCYVEELLPNASSNGNIAVNARRTENGVWQATEDELASEAYMKAFLETRKLLKDIAEFAVSGLPKT